MTPKKLPLVVADTCLFLAIFKNEIGRADASLAVLENHDRTHRVVLPTIVELELYQQSRLRDNKHQNTAERLDAAQQMQEFLDAWDCVTGDLTGRAVRHARELIPERDIKFADAAIVGTAIAVGAHVVYTWDDTLINACKGLTLTSVTRPPEVPSTLFAPDST